MKIEELASHLSTSDPDLTIGENLFVHSMPAEVKNGAFIVHEPGLSEVDHELPGIVKGRFQLIVRSTDYAQGYAVAMSGYKALNARNTSFGSIHVDYCRPLHTPASYRRSEGDVLEFSVNFDVRYTDPDLA